MCVERHGVGKVAKYVLTIQNNNEIDNYLHFSKFYILHSTILDHTVVKMTMHLQTSYRKLKQRDKRKG